MKALLAKPATRLFFKKLALLGQLTSPLEDAHLFMLKNRPSFCNFNSCVQRPFSSPEFPNTLSTTRCGASSLSNGAVPEIYNFIGICESRESVRNQLEDLPVHPRLDNFCEAVQRACL